MKVPVEIKVGDLDHSKFPATVGIVGSRSFEKLGVRHHVYADILRFVNKLPAETTLVSGGAMGVDTYAEQIADNFHRPKKIFYPDAAISSPARYFKRNRELVQYLAQHGGVLVSFIMINHHSGTSYTIKYCRELNVPRLTFVYDERGKFVKIVCDITLLKEFVKDD